MRNAAALALLSATMAGCVVGPNYQLPERALVNQSLAQQPLLKVPGTTSIQPPPDDWWKLYDDPVLNQLVREAMLRNVDLRIAAANLERAQADVQFAEAQGGFSGGLSGIQSREQLAGEQYLQSEKVPVAYTSDYGIKVTYDLDLFGTLKRGVEAAHADSEATEAARDVARVAVVSGIVGAYVEICGAGAELTVSQQVLAERRSRAQLIARLREFGRADESETAREETEVSEIEATIPQYRARQRVAQYQLATLLAESQDKLPESARECNRLPRLVSELPVGDATALLRRRPDIRQAERKLAAATARIGVSIGALYPSIILGASAGVTGATGDLGTGATQRWNIGPMITWTFPANGAPARIAAARAEQHGALARFDGAVLEALKDVQSSLATYDGAVERLRALERAHMSAVESADSVHRKYALGRATYLEDLDASRTLTGSELQLAESKVVVSLSQVDLFMSLGGGWQHADAASQ